MTPRPNPFVDEATLSRGWEGDLIELRHVEQVVEICRTGAITDAARNLNLTQSALSKSLARLEQQLGVQLFDRGGGSVRPTRYGQLLAAKGPALLGSASALRQEIALLATGATGRLRMGAGPASRIRPLKALIPLVVQTFPLLKLEVREESGDSLVQALAEGRYDIVFSYYESARPFGELMRVKVVEDRRAAVVRPGHPALELRRALTPRDLLKFPLASAGSIPAFKAWAGVMSAEELRNATAILCEDYGIIADCAMASDAIAWGPRFAFEGPLARGELVEIPITWPAKYACWMLTTEAHWKLPVVKAIADLARSLAPREAPPAAIAGA